MYELLLLIGALGFLAMTLLGALHGGGGHGGHSHGSIGHGAVGHGAIGYGHAGHGHLHVPKGLEKVSKGKGSSLLMLLSPIDLFAMALGAGAAGLLLRASVSSSTLPWYALVGALVFNFLIVKPIFALAFKFVSPQSEGLEGTVDRDAIAVTRFDPQGKGLVQLTMDGQIVQLLASLDVAELELGDGVSKGDAVRIVEIDAKRNTAKVTKLLRNP